MKTNLLFNQASALSKRLAMLLTMLLTVSIGQVWGAEYELDATQHITSNVSNYSTTEATLTGSNSSEWKVKGYGLVQKTSLTIGKGGANYLKTPICSEPIISITVTWSGNTSYYLALQTTSGTELEAVKNQSSSYTYTFDVSDGSYTQLQLVGRRATGTSNAAATITKVVVKYGASTPAVTHKAYFYNGTTLLNSGGTDFAEGAAVSYSGTTPESCDNESETFVGWATSTWSDKVAKGDINTDFYDITEDEDLPIMGTSDVTYYAVFAKETSTSTSGTLTLNSTNLSSAMGGAYSSDDFSYSGISFGRSNAAIMSSTIQIKAGTSNAVWNKTELPGAITSITVTKKTNNSVLTVGTSAKPTTNSKTVSSTTTYTFAENNNYRYFKIAATSSYTQVTSVVIKYSTTSSSYSDYITTCTTETVVTLNPNGGTISDNKWTLENGVYKLTTEDESITLPTITRTGYTFGGWATPSGGSYNANDIIPLDGNPVTMDAIWTANKYSITYKDQGNVDFSGTHEDGYPTQHTYGIATTLKGATKIGYTFNGWYTNSACTGDPITQLGATEYTGAITLYAQWTEKALVRYRTDCDACIPLTGDAYIEGTYHFFPGETITMTVTPPEDDVTYTYQWQKFIVDDWENIDGATTTTVYTKAEATIEDVGHYRCVVSAEGYCDAIAEYNVKCLQLFVYYNDKTAAFNVPLNKVDETTSAVSVNLENAGYQYYFEITDGCENFYGFNGHIHSGWYENVPLNAINNSTLCGLQTTKYGTYVFTVDHSYLTSDDNDYPIVTVTYPAGHQDADKVIYWDNNEVQWTHSDNDDGTDKIYYRIGRENHNNKIQMSLVPGTANLYTVTTTEYNDFEVWHIANNGCWSGDNPIYKTNTGDDWAATEAMAFETLPVTADAVTVTPTTSIGVGGEDRNNNCEFYEYDIIEGMKTWNAEVIAPTNGTITVTYTHHDGTAVNDFTSGDRDLAHTCLLTITATPPTGYNIGTLTVNGIAFTSGNVHTLTEDAVIEVTWQEKATPTFAWSEDACTATLEADNTFPTLNNPNSLSPVTYTSSNNGVATIDANGNITLVATGTTTITATGAETATHKSASDTYTLTVLDANCVWMETDIANINSGDEVVIAMEKNGSTYALADNNTAATSAPSATEISINANKTINTDITNISTSLIWNIDYDKEGTKNLVIYSTKNVGKWLYSNNANDGVRIGTNTNKEFKIVEGTGDDAGNFFLYHIAQARYLGVYYQGPDWRGYTTINTNNIAGQTLKFYKRICLDSENYWVTWDAGDGQWTDGASKKIEDYTVGETIVAPTEEPTREGYRFDGWEPAPSTMPAQNTTFTAVWRKVYKITWYENGVPSYTYVPSDNAVVTWEDNIADCGEKKFYGWTADDTFVSDPTTPPSLISKGTTIAGDVTYFAVYADAEEPANPGYTKVTTISEGTYLIATDATTGKAYTGKSGSNAYGGYCDVEIENDVISEKPDDAVEVIVTLGTGTNAGKFAIYDGTYYLSAPNGNSITFNNNVVYDWNLTNEGYIHSNGQNTRYLQYNSSSPRFACYTGTQKYAYLYKKQTTSYANFAVSCDKYTITITPPAGGTVTTNPADEAGAGQTITVNVTPADCKYLTALKYNDGSDHSINIASTPYTFTMPAADVTVTATFADKTATDIEILTSAHRMLMQGSAFVGEQVRITYNNGDKETLNWNDSRLIFTGHNTATLGNQTVTVTYNGCGTQSASYNIEVIDGLGITFWDGDYTETIKYEPGDLVDVDNKIGQNICSGWEFAGWSETKVANESNGFTPVHNFNATDAKVLYAVYVETSTDWISAYNIDELHPGAKYIIIAHYSSDNEYALTNTSTTNASYLDGAKLTTICEQVQEGDAYPYKYRYKLKVTPDENWKWQLENTGSGWTMRNIKANKYLKVNSDKTISLSATPDDKFTLSNGYNDSEITTLSSSNNYLSWYNSSKYWNGHTSGQQYYLTNETNFTSTPPCSPLSATFHGNGGIVTDGVNSGDNLTITEPTRDEGITTPTASFEDCNGKSWTFVGWSDKEVDVTRVPVLTTDLLHDGGGNKPYKIQEDGEEFWAVYTNQGTPETKYGTITFTDDDVTKQYENAKTITKSVTAMGDYDFELYHVSNASSKGIQFDHDNATRGYIKNITSLGKINSISFNDFQVGYINYVKVYVGNMPNAINTLLTEADLQQTGNTYTYYPPKNYAYVKIEATDYCGITSISIDFGKGTQIWATTPDCSTITLSGDEIYVTATNGCAVMAPTTLTVKANQLEANADVILTSNSSDVYFSTDRTFNFAAGQAESQKPTTSLTLPTDAEGNLATTDVYIHYMPNSEGNGVPADVVISANLETPNPSITDDHTIHVRNLPAKFVIATKVGATWYALPADMNTASNPLGVVIEVDETNMTATAPNSCTYTLFPVKTTNTEYDRYEEYGDRLRFSAVNNSYKGLWANNSKTDLTINNDMVIDQASDGQTGSDLANNSYYEWKVTTTVVDGRWQYTLQTDQTQNQNYLRYWTSAEGTPVGPKWGTYNAGENKLYFLPVTETQPFEYAVVEWYPTKVLIQTDAAITSPTVKVGGEKVASPILTSKGGKLYEISNLPLETNPNKLLQISFTYNAINYTNTKVVPIILSRGEKTITGEPFATLTQKVYQYADVVVRDGATLTIDGGTDVANTLLGMTIYPTAKVSVAEGKKLSVHSLTFFGGIDEIYDGSTYKINKYGVPQLSLKGILNKTVTTIDYIMRVDLEQMYQVGVPYSVNLNDITYWDGTTMTLGDNLYVSAYDGQKRANLEPKSWVWETEFVEKVLKAGIGYTISADMQTGVGNEYSIIRLPMKSNIASGNTEAAKTVQVYAYANKTGVEITDNNKGWNYLSNPYMAAISGAEADNELVVGYLYRNDVAEPWKWFEDGYRYVTIPSDDGTYYYQQKFSTATLYPFKSFFLQIATDGELSFDLANRQSAPARYLQSSNEQREVEFEVLLANDTRSDNLGFLIGEDYTPAYEINADLEKMIGSMSVYTIYNGYNLAYNALSPTNAAEQIPIGYVVPTLGEYTFALDESSDIEDVEHIYLIDYETSAITDLVTDVYTFTTLEQKSDTRFAINVALKSKDNTATGLDNMNTNSELPTKFIYQDKIYILHHGVIYDATGKRVITINK